jgi:predicted nucleotidyltransferase
MQPMHPNSRLWAIQGFCGCNQPPGCGLPWDDITWNRYGHADVLARLRENESALRDFPIQAIYVFGSVVRGEDRPRSDVDVLVEFEAHAHIGLFAFARLQRRLSEILGRPVDLVTPDALHEALRNQILMEAVRAA